MLEYISVAISSRKPLKRLSKLKLTREVNFSSDHVSDLMISERLVRAINQITYGFHTVPNRNIFTIPLNISSKNRDVY